LPVRGASQKPFAHERREHTHALVRGNRKHPRCLCQRWREARHFTELAAHAIDDPRIDGALNLLLIARTLSGVVERCDPGMERAGGTV
jgi:hypothetical protein